MKAAYVLIHGHQFLDGFRFDRMDIPDRHFKRIGNLILGHPLKVKQFDNLFLTIVQERYITVL